MGRAGAPRRGTLDDLFGARSLASQNRVALSPDASRLACPLHRDADRRYRGDLPEGAVPGTALGVRLAVFSLDTGARIEPAGEGITAWAPAWSPEGRRLAFYAAERDEGPVHLHLWDATTGMSAPLTRAPVVARGFPGEGPAWTWDGRALCVPVGPSGWPPAGERQDRPAVAVLEWPPPEPDRPEEPGAGGPSSPAWADLALVDAETGEVRRLLEGRPVHAGHPSPTTGDILWTEVPRQPDPARFEMQRALHLLRADGRDREAARWMEHGAVHHPPRWAPDGRRFAAVVDGQAVVWDAADDAPAASARRLPLPDGRRADGGFLLWGAGGGHVVVWAGGQLWRVDMEGRAEALAAPDREVVGVVAHGARGWLPPGDVLALTRDGATHRGGLWRLPAGGAVVEEDRDYLGLPSSPLVLAAGDATPDGRAVVYATRSAERPGEVVWAAGANGEGRRPIADLNAHLAGVEFGEPRLLRFRTADGEEVAARLRLPPGWAPGAPCPTVVTVYPGGRPSHRPHEFDGAGVVPDALLAAHGYAVLEPDVPYDRRASGDPSDAAARAALPAVDEAVRLGYADPGRLAVQGHSYGGYGVLALLCRTGRFRAAVASAAAADLASMYGSTPGRPGLHPDRTFGLFWCENGQAGMGGAPWERPLRYVANSPIFQLDRITTPLLLVAGEDDVTIPWTQAGEVFVGLRRLERACTLLVYRGEIHVPDRWTTANRRDLAERVLGWLERHAGERG